MTLAEGNVYHAACAKGLFGSETAPTFAYSMAELNELAKRLVLSHVSVPGVQAKLSVHLEQAEHAPDRLTLVGLDGNYILKLPTAQYPGLPESEHFAMTLARLCGIETAAFGLVRLESGALAYLTRRMDREDGVKHMIDFCQLTDRRTSRKYYGSHEQIARTIRRYATAAGTDVVRFFEVLLYSFLIGNSDMHLKNFSLLREHDGTWRLSPAYDLMNTALHVHDEDFALSDGLSASLPPSDACLHTGHPCRQDFEWFGNQAGIVGSRVSRILDKYTSLPDSVKEMVTQSRLTKKLQRNYLRIVKERISRFVRQDKE